MNYPWIDKANKIFSAVLIGQFLITLIIAFFTQTWLEGVLIGLFILGLPLFLINTAPFAKVTRHAVAIAVQLFAALHIQQTFGLTELHFEIFVMLAFLSCYRDWQVILTSVLFVAVHHVVFYIVQMQSAGLYVGSLSRRSGRSPHQKSSEERFGNQKGSKRDRLCRWSHDYTGRVDFG